MEYWLKQNKDELGFKQSERQENILLSLECISAPAPLCVYIYTCMCGNSQPIPSFTARDNP